MNFDTYGADGAPEVYAENRMALRRRGTDWGGVKELLAFCQAHKTAFVIKTGGYWGRSLLGLAYGVTYRVNDGPPMAEIWPGTETLDAALLPRDALAFMQSLPDEGSVSFAVTDALGHEHDATFRLRGVARARELIARACSKPL
ncbi:MAG TPA: hypothetical protein VKS78_15965 [Roseiarcus sp.]|nr:hypothetical protein [Roseiarcus sp.]